MNACRRRIRCGSSSRSPSVPWQNCRPSLIRCTPRAVAHPFHPERLLKASLLISLYSVRSERAFCEELDFHLLYRWFLDMSLMEPSFDPTVFTKNRKRLLEHDVARQFFDAVVLQAAELGLLSDEHFTVDGTLIEAAASLKSFRPRDEPPRPGVRRRHAQQSVGGLPWGKALEYDASESDGS